MRKFLNLFLALFFTFAFTFDVNLAQAGRRSPYDMAFSRYEIDQSSVLPGEQVKLSVVVRAAGRGHLYNGYTLGFYFGEHGLAPKDGERVGYRKYRRRLKRGRQRGETLNFKIPADTEPGKYQLHAVLDPDNKLDELNEGNNIQSFDLDVLGERVQLDPENYADNIMDTTTPNRYGPDIANYGLDYDRIYLHAGDSMRMRMRLRNIGRGSAAGGKVYWHFGSEPAYTLSTKIGESDYGYMRRRRYSSTRYDFKVPVDTTPGVYHLSYFIDATNTSVEKNEKNNSGSIRLAIMPSDVRLDHNNRRKTDLAASVDLENTTAQPGQSVKGVLSIKNQGLLNAESGYYYLSFSPNPMDFSREYLLARGKRFSKIPVGDSFAKNVGVGVPLDAKPGTYYFNYSIDGSREFNPKNNKGYVEVTVEALPEDVASGISFGGPDYAAKDVTLNKSEIKPGNGGKFTVFVTNIGTVKAQRNEVYFYLSQDLYNFGGQYQVCSTWHDGISHGAVQSEECHFNVPKTAAPGTYYLYYKIDARNRNDEVREDNNQGHLELTVLPSDESVIQKPDLYVSSSSLKTSNLKPGQRIEFEYEVHNRGRSTASLVKVFHYLTTDKDNLGNGIGSAGLGNIAFDQTEKGRVRYQLPANLTEGTYYLMLVVDPKNVVDEHSENNNRHVVELMVGNPPKILNQVQDDSSVPVEAAAVEVDEAIPPKPVYRPVRRGPDLRINKMHVDNKQLKPGDTVKGRLDLRNPYRYTAKKPVVYAYFGKNFDDLREVNMVKQIFFSNIRRRTASRDFEFAIPENAQGGANYIYFFVDPLNAVRENNEDNNFGSLIVNVEAPEPPAQEPVTEVVQPAPVVSAPAPVTQPTNNCRSLDKIERDVYGADACLPKDESYDQLFTDAFPFSEETPEGLSIKLYGEEFSIPVLEAYRDINNQLFSNKKILSRCTNKIALGYVQCIVGYKLVNLNINGFVDDATTLVNPNASSGQKAVVISLLGIDVVGSGIGRTIKSGVKVVDTFVRAGGKTYKAFTKSNYRDNLKILTGFEATPAHEAHHLFPKNFEQTFESLGLNIHDPRFLVWWNKYDHNLTSKQYNEVWARVLTPDYVKYLKSLSDSDRFYALKQNAIDILKDFLDDVDEVIELNFNAF